MQTPSQEMVYDTLAQLMQERKIYQTSRGFFIVTPERRRSRSRSSSRHHSNEEECPSPRTILMSDQEALHQLYGEITTTRDGAVTHQRLSFLMSDQEALHQLYGEITTTRDGAVTYQCVQTNLADVICGGKCLLSIAPLEEVLPFPEHNPHVGPGGVAPALRGDHDNER
ncbi:winged helix storkhead-box1 domain-containing protein [Phthorimaea operculella]|nr:winged helix storkhead-box1 domain-containing protein [Phthorimaea operculella]